MLHHGSYIKLGCLQFVFSIVEHAPTPPPSLLNDADVGIANDVATSQPTPVAAVSAASTEVL